MYSAYRHRHALRLEFDLAVWRCLHSFDEGAVCDTSFQAAKFVGRNNHNLIAAMHGDVLWAVGPDLPHQLAETGLGVLKQPETRAGPGRIWPWSLYGSIP